MHTGLGFAIALILGVFGWAVFGDKIMEKLDGRQ